MNHIKITPYLLIACALATLLINTFCLKIQIIHAEATPTITKAKFNPRKAPEMGYLGWQQGGYDLQPAPHTYAIAGDTIRLEGHTVLPFLAIPSAPQYQWWKSDDGNNWQQVTESKNHYLDITTTESGKTWYQLHTHYPGFLFFGIHDLYSEIATVHTQQRAIPATDIKIKTDSDYLFNTGNDLTTITTVAHALVTPEESTEIVQWESSNHNLAVIDAQGLITANTAGLSGDVTITGTVLDNNNKPLSDSKTIHIGGGLPESQIIHAGEPVHFALQTNNRHRETTDNRLTVKWHEINQLTGQDNLVATDINPAFGIVYTKKDANILDSGNKYYAEIIVHGKNDRIFKTNYSVLTVLPSRIPNVEVTADVHNETFSDTKNTTDNLHSVTNGDHLIYHFGVQNTSAHALSQSKLSLTFRSSTEITNVLLNSENIDSNNYQIEYLDENYKNLIIDIASLNAQEFKRFTIHTITTNIKDRETLTLTPRYYGQDYLNSDYQNDGNTLQINYINNKLNPQFKNIDFEPIAPLEMNTTKYRLIDSSEDNTVVTIDDQRRNKTDLKIYVTQNNKFHNGNDNLDVSLKYHKNGSAIDILNNRQLIAESQFMDSMHSIIWKKTEGLLLHVNNSHLKSGNYTSQLEWCFEDVIGQTV